MEPKSKIIKHMEVQDLITEIHELERDVKTLNHLYLILQVYKTNDYC
jgi:ribosomal protein S26